MRYRLRTLLIVLAVLPPLIGAGWWAWQEWGRQAGRAERGYWASVALILGIMFGPPLLVFSVVLVKGILSWIKRPAPNQP
jgi:hypothetical protein